MDVTNQQWWQYGAIGLIAVVFAVVIRFLFKKYEAQIAKNLKLNEAVAEERKGWAVEREKIRAEYDTRHHELLRQYAEKLQQEHKECTEREDMLRREHADMVERMADEQRKANDSMIEMLQKLQEKMVFQRGGRY